ncbi:MAG: EndoU domain-containing protein [Chromatiales bacterium]|nr:EndoU domain-containing protein [Gammaproteobacteria bacterium]
MSQTTMKQTALLFFLLILSLPALAFQPFFDNDPKTRHAPEDPDLTDFDLEVLALCGNWGDEVEAVDFEQMMLDKSNTAVLQRIRKAVGGRIFSKARDNKQFAHELRRVWFEQKGFKHVFCGEPGSGRDLGGLHYAARYWQAQDNNWAGYRKLKSNYRKRPVEKCRAFYLKESIKPPIYTISLQFKNPYEPRNKIKCLSGYNREMNAEDILIAGTRAFKQANKRVGKNTKDACLFDTRPAGKKRHFSTMVIKQRALRTFYPMTDKKPYCKKNRKNFRACLCSNL